MVHLMKTFRTCTMVDVPDSWSPFVSLLGVFIRTGDHHFGSPAPALHTEPTDLLFQPFGSHLHLGRPDSAFGPTLCFGRLPSKVVPPDYFSTPRRICFSAGESPVLNTPIFCFASFRVRSFRVDCAVKPFRHFPTRIRSRIFAPALRCLYPLVSSLGFSEPFFPSVRFMAILLSIRTR